MQISLLAALLSTEPPDLTKQYYCRQYKCAFFEVNEYLFEWFNGLNSRYAIISDIPTSTSSEFDINFGSDLTGYNFAARVKVKFKIVEAGDYFFRGYGDDKIKVIIDGDTVLEDSKNQIDSLFEEREKM